MGGQARVNSSGWWVGWNVRARKLSLQAMLKIIYRVKQTVKFFINALLVFFYIYVKEDYLIEPGINQNADIFLTPPSTLNS